MKTLILDTRRRLLVAVSVGSLAVLSASAAGSETMFQLLKILKDRGSITEAEYSRLLDVARAETQAPPPATPVTATPSAEAEGHPAQDKAAGGGQQGGPKEPPDRWEQAREKLDMSSPSPEAIGKALQGKWYERVNLRGYTQLRYHEIIQQDGADLNVPNDRSVSETQSFWLRRGRMIFSGDVTDHLFLYAQADFAGSPLDGADFALQMRDLYADISVDRDKEFRFRVGQSKVPYGWVNMQSSQNRAPLERPDALNSAVEGERDIGAFFYWAPKEVRDRYRELVRSGLKGSGDYGVVGVGAYSGQGLNRGDANGEPHVVARLNYPWKLADGQFVEAGIQAYRGKFVSGTSEITMNGGKFTPSIEADGVEDRRVGASFIYYPQPWGIEAEWNVGTGPELNPSRQAIESDFLHGGYVQVGYRIEKCHGDWYPFTRWHYFDGGRKFGRNAPHEIVNELDFGIEWQPLPEVEVTLSYTHTFERTNTRLAPFAATESADRVGVQVQFNY